MQTIDLNRLAALRAGALTNESDCTTLADAMRNEIRSHGGNPPASTGDVLQDLEALGSHATIVGIETPKHRTAASAGADGGGSHANGSTESDGRSLTEQCFAAKGKTRYPGGPAAEAPALTGESALCNAEMQKHRAKKN